MKPRCDLNFYIISGGSALPLPYNTPPYLTLDLLGVTNLGQTCVNSCSLVCLSAWSQWQQVYVLKMHFSGRSSAHYLIVDITISTQKIVAGRLYLPAGALSMPEMLAYQMKIMKCTKSITKSWQIMHHANILLEHADHSWKYLWLRFHNPFTIFSFQVEYVPIYPIAGLYFSKFGEIATVGVKTLGMHKTASWELVSI